MSNHIPDTGKMVPDAWMEAADRVLVPGKPMTTSDLRKALAAVAPLIAKAERERCIAAGQKAWPKAHTYASENADMYRAQDHAAATVLAAIRALGDADE